MFSKGGKIFFFFLTGCLFLASLGCFMGNHASKGKESCENQLRNGNFPFEKASTLRILILVLFSFCFLMNETWPI